MATIDFNKENLGPLGSNDVFGDMNSSPANKKEGRKGRSKSIGPGALDEISHVKKDSRDRRKSAFIPATKSILSRNEDAQKAARRKTMSNRRVSFAPEATLHTWDVIELAREMTTSTDSSDSTRRNSQFAHSSSPDSDAEEPEAPSGDVDEEISAQSTKSRRSSEIPPMNFNNPDDLDLSSVAGDESGSDGAEESDEQDDNITEEESEDDEGTAMSLDIDDATVQSVATSEESTGSSARLEASLRQAAQTAGTRGIEFDEYGDMSMEMASEEITNAFKPWVQQIAGDQFDSAAMDQENINPFVLNPKVAPSRPHAEEGDDDDEGEDISMDMTRAVGGIMKNRQNEPVSSPFSDGTMEMTQAVGKITSQKRQYSTAESGSPGVQHSEPRSKRRRSSAARSSMGDDSMELTMVVGRIHTADSPAQTRRTRSMGRRRSSGIISEAEEPTATMEFTRAVGGIKEAAPSEQEDGVDDNEELSMELTTALGNIRGHEQMSPLKAESPTKSPKRSPKKSPKSRLSVDAATSPAPKFRQQSDDSETHQQTSNPEAAPDQKPEDSNAVSPETSTPTARRRSQRKPRVSSPMKSPSPSKTKSSDEENASSEIQEEKIVEQPLSSPAGPAITYPDLSSLEDGFDRIQTPPKSSTRPTSYRTPESGDKTPTKTQAQAQRESPMLRKQQRNAPEHVGHAADDTRTLAKSIKLLSTPRKETLRTVSPMKRTPVKPTTPMQATPKGRRTPKERSEASEAPTRKLNEDLAALQSNGQSMKKVGLQEFLTTAGIRFMDLTTTKRRVTTAPTPSKGQQSKDTENENLEEHVTLENSIVAAACTAPELDLCRHACHELKRYTKEGKQMVAELEEETAIENPPLIQAYVNASPHNRNDLDAQMRDMKTNARFRSKEQWYSWRSKLLDELMMGLQKIGEGLIQDDDLLGQAEAVLDQVLPDLIEQHENLREEAEQLEKTANIMTDAEKEEIQSVREDLSSINAKLEEKHRILEQLRRESEEQDQLASDLGEKKLEFLAAIQEANRVREACRGISSSEVASLQASVQTLESTSGWRITSASTSPSTVTMTYKSELELTFQPASFATSSPSSASTGEPRPNSPISLAHLASDPRTSSSKSLPTSLRFFLQLLRATLQGLPQHATRIPALLTLVSQGWETARALAETERRLALEVPVDTHIRDDGRLDLRAVLMLPRVRTKVHVTFAVRAWVSGGEKEEGGEEEEGKRGGRGKKGALRVRTAVAPEVAVVYGECYNEGNMTEFMRGQILTREGGDDDDDDDDGDDDGFRGDWDGAIREIRAKLVRQGAKGARK